MREFPDYDRSPIRRLQSSSIWRFPAPPASAQCTGCSASIDSTGFSPPGKKSLVLPSSFRCCPVAPLARFVGVPRPNHHVVRPTPVHLNPSKTGAPQPRPSPQFCPCPTVPPANPCSARNRWLDEPFLTPFSFADYTHTFCFSLTTPKSGRVLILSNPVRALNPKKKKKKRAKFPRTTVNPRQHLLPRRKVVPPASACQSLPANAAGVPPPVFFRTPAPRRPTAYTPSTDKPSSPSFAPELRFIQQPTPGGPTSKRPPCCCCPQVST